MRLALRVTAVADLAGILLGAFLFLNAFPALGGLQNLGALLLGWGSLTGLLAALLGIVGGVRRRQIGWLAAFVVLLALGFWAPTAAAGSSGLLVARTVGCAPGLASPGCPPAAGAATALLIVMPIVIGAAALAYSFRLRGPEVDAPRLRG
jgi:hypothetical protein